MSICLDAPELVKRRFTRCGGVIPKAMSAAEMQGPDSGTTGAAGTASCSRSVVGEDFIEVEDRVDDARNLNLERSESTQIPSRVDSSNPRTMRQQHLAEAYHITKRKELDEKWAAFFYEANVPFNVVRHPAFIAAVEATSTVGFDYRPPKYNAMRTRHIEPMKNAVKQRIEEKTKQCITLYGATICSDGWDNVVRRPLMNVMLVCPVGDIFLGSIDTTGNKKDKTYIAAKLTEYIELVDPANVVQICSDNASAMLGAMDKVVEVYPHIYKQGCAAHIIDLLLEDWGKEATFKELTVMGKRICKYIRIRHVPMALFRQFSPNLSLLLPAETRFACQFLMIRRLLKVKAALVQVVVHQKWEEYVNTLFNRQNGTRAHALASLVRQTILDETFWGRCENFVHLVEPALVTLRTFDGQKPAMGRAWLAMNNLKNHVFALRDAPFLLDPVIASRFEEQFNSRWKMMLTDLHYAGALLNPYLTDCVELQRDGGAKRARNRVLRHLSGSLRVDHNEVMNELTHFEERTGPYGPLEAPDIRETRMQPHQWWQRVGGDALPVIAKRILSLTCSASSCERNWSMYSFVHNKVRNRLGVKKAEDLVYIYTNSKLLRERRGADPVHWYDNQPYSEDSDPDFGSVLDEENSDNDHNAGGRDCDNDGGNSHGEDGANNRPEDGGDDSFNDGSDSTDDGDEYPMRGDDGNEPPSRFPQRNEDERVFNWSDTDAEPIMERNDVVSPLQDAGNNKYDRADDDINDDQGTNGHLPHGDNDGDGTGGHSDPVQPIRTRSDEPNDCSTFQQRQPNVHAVVGTSPVEDVNTRNIGTDVIAENHAVAPEDDVPIGQLFSTPMTQSTPSVGAIIAGLRRVSPSPSPLRPRPDRTNTASQVLHAMASIRSSKTTRRGGPSNARRGVKRSSLAPTDIRPFCSGNITTASEANVPFVGTRGINEDGVNDRSKRRKYKKIITTVVDGTFVGEVRNLTSTVEAYAPNPLGDEDEACGDDEGSGSSNDSHAEVPNDKDFGVRALAGMPGNRKNPRRYRKRKK